MNNLKDRFVKRLFTSFSILLILIVTFSNAGIFTPNLRNEIASASPTYTVTASGSTYVTKNPSGSIIYSGTLAASSIMTATRLAKSGDTITILGTFLVNSMITINGNFGPYGLTITGDGKTVIKAMSGCSSYLWNVQGSYIKTQYITFDDNGNTAISPVVQVTGNYDTVTYCSFINSKTNGPDYTLNVYSVKTGTSGAYFTFTYNTITHSKYGIAVSAAAGQYATNGLIAYNKINECWSACIKLRWAKDVVVRDNILDTCVFTWAIACSPTGIRFGHVDGPTVNCKAINNVITYSGGSKESVRGIFVDNDARGLSSGVVIQGNTIKNQYYGVMNYWKYVQIIGNTLTNCRYGIYLGTSSISSSVKSNVFVTIYKTVTNVGVSNTIV